MDVRMPDGTIIKNVPEDITQDELASRLKQVSADFSNVKSGSSTISKPSFFDVPAITNPTPENIAADPFMRFAAGAGRSTVGLSQLLNRASQKSANPLYSGPSKIINSLLGQRTEGRDVPEAMADWAKLGKEGMRARGEEFDIAGTAGEILNPIGIGATKAIPAATGVIGRIGQAGGLGSLYSTLQPYTKKDGDYDLDKIADAVVGFGTGAVIQGGVVEPVKYGARLVHQFFTQAGAKEISKKYLDQILGEGGLDKLVSAVEKRLPSVGKGPVSEYKPTTGELVADVPEAGPFLALQYKTSSTSGGPSGQFRSREIANEQAIRNAIGSFAGTPQTLKSAINTADTNAAANYGPLMGRMVSPESDVNILLQQIQQARGVPQWQPSQGSGPYVGRAGALQQWGKAATDQAQQTALSNKWTPVEGMPRVSGRYSPNAEVAQQASQAARDALYEAGTRGKQAEFLEAMLSRLERNGMLATEGIDPLISRPSMAKALDYAQKMAAERGYKFPSSLSQDFTVQNLHDIKLGLDAQIRAGAVKNQPTSLDNATLKSIGDTKDAFLNWLEAKVPAYGKARIEYSKDMTPVNQQEVGQALLKKLTSPTGAETPGTFLRAIDDETKLIKNVTGQPRQDFGQVLNPRQVETVTEVGNILENKLASLSPVRRASLPGGADIAKQVGFELPSILSRPIVIANWLIKTLRNKTSPLEARVDAINAEWMLNPEAFVKAIKTMNAQEKNLVINALRSKGVDPVAAGLIAPAAIGTTGLLSYQE